MKYRYYLIVLFFIMCRPIYAGAEQYLCVADYANGFSYNDNLKSWEPTNFKTDEKFIISAVKKGEEQNIQLLSPKDSKFKITKVGSDSPYCSCKESFNDYGFLFCDCFGGEFKFNKDNGRFLYSYLYGYYNIKQGEKDDNKNTPYISIGKCSPF